MSENYDGNKPIGAFSSLQTYLTYSWINNDLFYQLIPTSYVDYYQRFVKQWFYWYDGWVPYFHNHQSGMVSTGLAYTLIKKLAEKTVGNKLMFDDEGVQDLYEIEVDGKMLNSLSFIEYWSDRQKMTPKLKSAFQFAYAGGDSVLKLDSNGKDLFLNVLRKDNYLIDTDFRGEIFGFLGFLNTYSKFIRDENQQETRQHYYVVEERKYIDDIPKFRIAIKKSNSSLTNAKSLDANFETVNWDRLPNDISRKFKKDYKGVDLGIWYDMGIEDLGIYQIKASERVHFLPDAPFGESVLSNLIALLMTYDFYFSSLTTNLYTSRDKVLLPQHMQGPKEGTYDAQLANYNTGLDSYIYTKLPYMSPEDQSPLFIQPQLRDWASTRNNLLQSVAMNVGVDERTIMASIVPNSEKPTAREISTDEDTTSSFVEEKRQINLEEINKCLRQVLYFYGFKDEEVTARFSRAGLNNINNVVTIATLLKQNGLADTKTLVEMVFLDKNDKQIQNILNALKEEKEEQFKQEQQKNKMDTNVEENIEQQETVTEYQVPKNKGKD